MEEEVAKIFFKTQRAENARVILKKHILAL